MEDVPIAAIPTDIDNWSENFALAGYDPKANIGVFMHVGRWRKDLSLWREMVTVALPDGSIIAHRAIGNANATAKGPGGPMAGMTVVEQGRHLQWYFHGGARRVPAGHLLQGQLRSGPSLPVSFTLDFKSDLPIWTLGNAASSDFAGQGHDEQIGRMTGEIRCGDEIFRFDAEANRDHSRGPRVIGPVNRHLWFQGMFENGLRFYAYTANEGDDPAPRFAEAAVVLDGVMTPAKIAVEGLLPDADPLDHIEKPIRFTLTYGDKVVSGQITSYPHSIYCQFTAPWDTYVGAWPKEGDICNRFLSEQSVLYRLDDGTQGYGHLERTVPGRVLQDDELVRLAEPA